MAERAHGDVERAPEVPDGRERIHVRVERDIALEVRVGIVVGPRSRPSNQLDDSRLFRHTGMMTGAPRDDPGLGEHGGRVGRD